MTAETAAVHILLDLYNCDPGLLRDSEALRRVLQETADENGLTVLNGIFHRFEPHGVSGVLLISESHMSVHTWPEHGYAAVDVFSCRPGISAEKVRASLEKRLRPGRVRMQAITRGKGAGLPEDESASMPRGRP